MTMLEPKFINNKHPYLDHKTNKRKKIREILATEKVEKLDTTSFYISLLCLIIIFTILAYFRES